MSAWEASAPANIALVKYMGKETGNQATNPSLSLTLKDFRSTVRLTASEKSGADRWEPLKGATPLRRESTEKFLRFFAQLKAKAGVEQAFTVESGNNFPSDSGIASSASSFAALTLAAHKAFAELTGKPSPSTLELARISREGSGSSCRSFFAPWCAWEGDNIYALEAKLPPLVDLVVLASEGFKTVSSSEAHQRVRTSPLFPGRTERAIQRQERAKKALKGADYQELAALAWEDLWDMHSLFHTSNPPFFYFSPDTLVVLKAVEKWRSESHGAPIATIDAGPHVHLLVPASEQHKWEARLKSLAQESKRELRWLVSHA